MKMGGFQQSYCKFTIKCLLTYYLRLDANDLLRVQFSRTYLLEVWDNLTGKYRREGNQIFASTKSNRLPYVAVVRRGNET